MRRIKTSILQPNNLTLLASRATYNHPDTHSNNSSRFTLKSLSQQRNIVKILRKMDSPNKSHLSGESLKSQVFETLTCIQEQVHALNRNRNKDRRESMERVLHRGVPRSKISLTEKNKENVCDNTPGETNRTTTKELNISKAILEKLKVIPLRNTDEPATTHATSNTNSLKQLTIRSKQSLNISTCKRRGIYLYQRLK